MTEPEACEAARAADTAESVAAAAFRATAKAAVLAMALLLALVILRYTRLGTHISKENIQAFVSGFGLLAPAFHVAIYAVGTTVLVPATVFTLIGAVVFGKLLGTIYNLIGRLAAPPCHFSPRAISGGTSQRAC